MFFAKKKLHKFYKQNPKKRTFPLAISPQSSAKNSDVDSEGIGGVTGRIVQPSSIHLSDDSA